MYATYCNLDTSFICFDVSTSLALVFLLSYLGALRVIKGRGSCSHRSRQLPFGCNRLGPNQARLALPSHCYAKVADVVHLQPHVVLTPPSGTETRGYDPLCL
jgi:hypothetical protein